MPMNWCLLLAVRIGFTFRVYRALSVSRLSRKGHGWNVDAFLIVCLSSMLTLQVSRLTDIASLNAALFVCMPEAT